MKESTFQQLSFPEVRIVEASAGSGKTYTLARRYVQLLINPQSAGDDITLRNILAITFTNKAAWEMKDRIFEFLKKIALDSFADEKERENILLPLCIDKQAAQLRAYKILEYIIRHYNFFQVQTIDSFINALLVGCAFKIQLSSNFRIKHNYGEYLRYSLDKLIDRAGQDKKLVKIFDDFLRQYLFVENKKSWFPKHDILNIIGDLFYHRNVFGREFKKYDLKGLDLLIEQKKIIRILNQLLDNAPEGTDGIFLKKLTQFVKDSKGYFNFKEFADSQSLSKEDFPIKKGYPLPKSVENLWKNLRQKIKNLSEQEAYSLFNCYIDISERVFSDFKELSGRDDVVFLEELNRLARGLFDDESTTVAELYYRLATRFKHYLIDEFQDTSILQWRNFKLMVEEALATGGTLFCVGDKKQAIYRFRGGEAALFERIKEKYRLYNMQIELLGKNYRSEKEIVNFNNEVFSSHNLRRFVDQMQIQNKSQAKVLTDIDIRDILAVFSDAQQEFKEKNSAGFVKTQLIESQDKEDTENIMHKKLLELVSGLSRRFSYKDIAILTRGNKEVELVSEWLIAAEIPVESEKTLNIRENPYIKELICLLKFLNAPIDNLSFVSFIFGEIFRRASGLSEKEIRKFIFELRAQGRGKDKQTVYFYQEFRKKYPGPWDAYLSEFFKNVGFVPLYEFVVSIFNKFSVSGNFPDYQGFFMKFLELIKQQEEENASLTAFLEFFETAEKEDLYVDIADTDAVKVLTIHKSKGLEFSVVVIPFLTMNAEPGFRSKRGSVSYLIKDDEEEDVALIRLHASYTKFSPKIRERYRQEYKKSLIDELNSIYVAFTRAKNELYVYLPKKTARRYNPAVLLIPGQELERGKQIKYPPAAAISKLPTLEIPPSVNQDWITFLKDEFVSIDQIKNRKRIQKGEVLHYILSLIGNLEGQDKDKIVKDAFGKTQLRYRYYDNYKQLEPLIAKLISAKQCRPFFFVDKGAVFQEKELVDSFGATRRIDRLILKEKEIWVIDYKTSAEQLEDYKPQILEYMNIVKDIYPNKKIKGFLVSLEKAAPEQIGNI